MSRTEVTITKEVMEMKDVYFMDIGVGDFFYLKDRDDHTDLSLKLSGNSYYRFKICGTIRDNLITNNEIAIVPQREVTISVRN